jgi:hypothetical protein
VSKSSRPIALLYSVDPKTILAPRVSRQSGCRVVEGGGSSGVALRVSRAVSVASVVSVALRRVEPRTGSGAGPRSCASPVASGEDLPRTMLSRMVKVSRRTARAMSVARLAERFRGSSRPGVVSASVVASPVASRLH